MKPLPLLATCLPGLEEHLAHEMRAIELSGIEVVPGGVRFMGHANAIARANLELGTATRVLVELGFAEARHFKELAERAADFAWERVLAPGQAFDVRAQLRKCKLMHSSGVEERVALGVLDRLGGAEPPEVDDDAELPTIRVRGENDRFHMSLDTSGAPLHRRGWRLATAKAPLREDLACALILASGWDLESPLVDPLCGSGTLVIEAARLLTGQAAGIQRSFAFELCPPLAQASRIDELRDAAKAREEPRPGLVFGSDRDAGAIEAAIGNAERAGLAESVCLERRAISNARFIALPSELDEGEDGPPADEPLPERVFVVCNPPFGPRLTGDLRPLYQRLGALLRERPGWSLTMITGDERLARRSGLELERLWSTRHGGHELQAFRRKA